MTFPSPFCFCDRTAPTPGIVAGIGVKDEVALCNGVGPHWCLGKGFLEPMEGNVAIVSPHKGTALLRKQVKGRRNISKSMDKVAVVPAEAKETEQGRF